MPENEVTGRTSRRLMTKDIFKDKPFIILLSAGLLVVAVIAIRVLVAIKQYDVDIPVRYSQFGDEPSFINGNWYTHYELMAMAFAIWLANGFLALRLYRSERWLSLMILSSQIAILVLLLVITASLLGTSAVAA